MLLAGCLSMDEPAPTTQPSPASPEPSPAASTISPSEAPRAQDELVVAVPDLPDRLLPPAADASDTIALDLVHRTLYRLDPRLVPVPDLAGGPPEVSKDGLTWTVPLALDGARFASGRPISAQDVAGSLSLARSPVCIMERDLCGTVLAHLDSAEASEDGASVALHLEDPFSPLLAEALARLPILDMTAVDEAATAMVAAAGDLDPTDPDRLVTSVFRAMGADGCITEEPPVGCRIADHQADLEAMLTKAGVALPRPEAFEDGAGQVDRAAYATALLDRVAALGQVLTGAGRDRRAAALGLLDGFVPALGAGPYRVTTVVPGERMLLTPIPGEANPPAIARIVLEVVTDPSVAATRLQAGEVDWVPRVDQALSDAINGSGRPAHAGVRPLDASWVLVFNTRKGRPYADAPTRAAFAACVDRADLTRQVGGGEAIAADGPLAAGSWAMGPAPGDARDVARADRLLDLAGWGMGADGIRVRDGQRLSSSVALRTSQAHLMAMMQAVAGQLRECGIELLVEDLDVTGDRLLEQLRWPNDFDTLLVLRPLGTDPDADLQAFEGAHATTADPDHAVDSNPGGFRSGGVDRRVARARATLDRDERTRLYGEVLDLLTTEAPAWWVWYETGWSAIADRVRGADGGLVDPSRPRYEHDVRAWSLLPMPTTTPAARPATDPSARTAPSAALASPGPAPESPARPPSADPPAAASGAPSPAP